VLSVKQWLTISSSLVDNTLTKCLQCVKQKFQIKRPEVNKVGVTRGIGRRTEEIQLFIVDQVKDHPEDIGRLTREKFGISRAAVSKHLQDLISKSVLQ